MKVVQDFPALTAYVLYLASYCFIRDGVVPFFVGFAWNISPAHIPDEWTHSGREGKKLNFSILWLILLMLYRLNGCDSDLGK